MADGSESRLTNHEQASANVQSVRHERHSGACEPDLARPQTPSGRAEHEGDQTQHGNAQLQRRAERKIRQHRPRAVEPGVGPIPKDHPMKVAERDDDEEGAEARKKGYATRRGGVGRETPARSHGSWIATRRG